MIDPTPSAAPTAAPAPVSASADTAGHGSAGTAGLTLRPAEPQDLDGLCALLRTADLPVDGVADQFPDGYVVAVDTDGRLVGAAGVEVHERHGLLRSVVVTPALGRRGLGAALVHDRLAWSRRAGLQSVALLTTTAADFFERLGFRTLSRDQAPDGIRQSAEFAALCPASAVFMSLDPAAPQRSSA